MNPLLIPVGLSFLFWLMIPVLLIAKLFLKPSLKEKVDVMAFVLVLLGIVSFCVFIVLARN